MKKYLSTRFGGIYIFFVIFMSLAFLSRLFLTTISISLIEASFFELIKVFGVGLFFDFTAFFYFIVPFVVYLTFIPEKIYQHKIQKGFTTFFFLLVTTVIVFSAFAEWFFWDEFGVRYNFIAVDYLIYTNEVVRNIFESYNMPLYISCIAAIVGGIFYFINKKGWYKMMYEKKEAFFPRLIRGVAFLVIPILSFIIIDHSFSKISTNKFNRELSKNGVYSIFAAFRNNELDYYEFYASYEDEKAFDLLRKNNTRSDVVFASDDFTNVLKTVKKDSTAEKKHNIMFICVESLSKEYMEHFGMSKGIPVTPHLDRIADEGILFTNFYATGTRTIRGMEALTLSIPPTPGRSIVKRMDNNDLFSNGRIFEQKGYDVKFIYGGDGYFDNMNTYFSNNGYKIVDRGRKLLQEGLGSERTNIEDDEVTFENAWGVCDEDLFAKASKEADKSHAANQPFYSFVMTTSNHRPFSYPEGKIDIPSKQGRNGGVKYTDFAINKFFEESKDKPWFNNTIFVVVADHCGSSAGARDLEIREYQIPLIIWNPELIQPQKVDKLCSQIDVTPTLCGMLNWEYKNKYYGKNIFDMAPEEERALIGNYQKLALLKKDKICILSPQKDIIQYQFDRESGHLEPTEENKEMTDEAISYYQSAAFLYKNNLYKWED